jgi:hypothetical protein
MPQAKITFSHLPLAIYRELAVHLRQIPRVETALISQDSPEFNYQDSQVSGLLVTSETSIIDSPRVREILKYYSDRYAQGSIEQFMIEVVE